MRLTRVVVAAALVVSAVVHLVLYFDGFAEIPVIGPLFLVNVVAGVALGVVVVAWKHWLPAFGAAGFGAATLGAFLMSRTVGLFGVREMTWDVWAVVAAISEVVAIIGGILLMAGARRRQQGSHERATGGGSGSGGIRQSV